VISPTAHDFREPDQEARADGSSRLVHEFCAESNTIV